MRLVTWNCNCSLKKKLERLLSLAPDIAILQECEKSITIPDGYYFLWIGDNEKKGLGILSRIKAAPEKKLTNHNWTYFLPLVFPELQLRLVATWAFNRRASKFGIDRIGAPTEVFPQLNDWLSTGPSIVAGDFNHSEIWDMPGKSTNFANIRATLSDANLRSAYHTFMDEAFGSETRATHFHTKNMNKPYHIDYCFLHESLQIQNVSIPDFNDWLLVSDHIPLIVDFDL